jgi:hypothetical protein
MAIEQLESDPNTLSLLAPLIESTSPKLANGDNTNKLLPEDRPVHEWYRFVLSFPPHLVRAYLERFGADGRRTALDPFCGTGTTIVECKKHGIPSIGIEANPMAHFASQVKVDWSPDPNALVDHADQIAEAALEELSSAGIEDVPLLNLASDSRRPLRTLPPEQYKLLLTNSISPFPLHKTLVLLDCLKRRYDERFYRHELIALAKALVGPIGNLHFGPEVGVGPAKPDAPVVASWLANVRAMANDLRQVKSLEAGVAAVHLADARQILRVLEPNSVDIVITSPPYPNEKDYTRTTRLESVLLGLIRSKADLRALKQSLVRSNTRGVYTSDTDDRWIADHAEIQRIAEEIEARRIELGKTSGFERLYSKVTKLYFGGMAKHLADLRAILRPGARLAYVVGDQASYLRVMIRTGQLLAQIGESLGYEVVGIDLFRSRLATATREQLREEVVILRWPAQTSKPLKVLEQSSGGYEVTKLNRYAKIIERVFFSHYKEGAREVSFDREDIVRTAKDLGIKLPKNLGDVIYSFRYRTELPASVQAKAPKGKEWIIRPAGTSRYQFVATTLASIAPTKMMAETKVPEATPGVIAMYALNDEQALLAKLRYNRLIDIFTGVTCYSLQNHLRTAVPDIGQIETDEIYIGLDRRGAHYVFPVQAKGGNDKLSVVQVEQDFALCADKFPSLICRPIGAQFMEEDLIALFELEQSKTGVAVVSEKHYRLVPSEDVTAADLDAYRSRPL